MTTYARPRDVLHAAENWSEGQVACRALTGHNWQAHTVRQSMNAGRPYLVIQRCDNCGNQRERSMNSRTGQWISPKWSIRYVRGYLMEGLGRVDADGKAALRLRIIDSVYTQGASHA